MAEQDPETVKVDAGGLWRIRKNVAVITLALMMQFTATTGASNLQSSINAKEGLGTAAMVAVFVGVLVSNIFLTSIIIKYLGTKWTICCSLIMAIPFIAFQMYPRFSTLVPAGLLMGLGTGIKYCAKNTYITVLAEANSIISKTPVSTVLLGFSGFFFMVTHMSQFWGNLISSLVLSSTNNASVTSVNETMIPYICGTNFLPKLDAAKALPTQPLEKIMTLSGIYLACMAGAILLITVALDSMKRYDCCRKAVHQSLPGFQLLAVTVKQLEDSNQQLILGLNIFVGLQQGFFAADFTASFVSCIIGPGSVGYVMMTYGCSNIVACLVTTYLAKLFGRLSMIYCALCIHGAIFVTLLSWSPHAGDYYVMIIIAMLWGICDSIWVIQINTCYGVTFRGKEEAAFSNLGLWEGVGYIISYSLSSYVRTRYKVYLLICSLIVGVTGYLIVEYRQKRSESIEESKKRIRNKEPTAEDMKRTELEKFTV